MLRCRVILRRLWLLVAGVHNWGGGGVSLLLLLLPRRRCSDRFDLDLFTAVVVLGIPPDIYDEMAASLLDNDFFFFVVFFVIIIFFQLLSLVS
jgi:hypothetical protein